MGANGAPRNIIDSTASPLLEIKLMLAWLSLQQAVISTGVAVWELFKYAWSCVCVGDT